MNNYLTDEDIHAFDEPSDEAKEIAKLKMRIIKNEEQIEIDEYLLDNIVKIVNNEIKRNITRTKMSSAVGTIKAYREELKVLRELEKLLEIYEEKKNE